MEVRFERAFHLDISGEVWCLRFPWFSADLGSPSRSPSLPRFPPSPRGYSGSWRNRRSARVRKRTRGTGVKRRDRKEAESRREFRRKFGRLSAASQQEMMRSYAEANRRKEAKTKGLVILRGVYGDEAAIGGTERNVETEKALDVTVALQFMVENSKLRLYAGSKKDYVGFCEMGGEERKPKLYVRYAYNGFVYELEVEDAEPLYLPAFRATLLGPQQTVS